VLLMVTRGMRQGRSLSNPSRLQREGGGSIPIRLHKKRRKKEGASEGGRSRNPEIPPALVPGYPALVPGYPALLPRTDPPTHHCEGEEEGQGQRMGRIGQRTEQGQEEERERESERE
jgi:hypothetical protein